MTSYICRYLRRLDVVLCVDLFFKQFNFHKKKDWATFFMCKCMLRALYIFPGQFELRIYTNYLFCAIFFITFIINTNYNYYNFDEKKNEYIIDYIIYMYYDLWILKNNYNIMIIIKNYNIHNIYGITPYEINK